MDFGRDPRTADFLCLTKLLYALRVIRTHGLSQQSFKDMFRTKFTVEAKLQYTAPAWSGCCTAGDRDRLNAFLRRCLKLGYKDKSAPFIEDIFSDCDDQLFARINTNSFYILQQYLRDRSNFSYSLRPRRHNKTLITKTCELNDRDFIIINIYRDLY